MAGMAILLAALLANERGLSVGVRAGVDGDGVVEFDLQNVSGKTLVGEAEIHLSLRPVDRTVGPLFGGTLWSSADPVTGEFGGHLARGRTYPPSRRVTTLRLEPNEKRTVPIRLLDLQWSLAPQWVEQPRGFWELAGAGEYWLSAQLLVFEGSVRPAFARDVRLRISGQRGVSPIMGMKLKKPSAASTLAPQAALGRRCRLMPAPSSPERALGTS